METNTENNTETNIGIKLNTNDLNKYCRNCGCKLEENAKFCPNCGEEVITSRVVIEKQLKEKIRPYKLLINPNPVINDNTKISFIRFKNGKFSSVCSEGIDTKVFDIKLKKILIDNKIDYAIIPLIEPLSEE